ncbi:DUF4352 domain-containing protein [Cellulomonas dongxiuzhuiae]|uniref:DUF4352 domain-containing protein n=1 Tax=Cellulomonas dongxiuzhuiae TaxID=2819979 RepID=A0ABX8GJI9_9CELL|nr:DUF4352 domain-containing protein [Cellulomonas dongxiuzhuiae]QWC15826.1 DUF4352 domain-containing protein [Cellulomonas dongxiuzhuiae]
MSHPAPTDPSGATPPATTPAPKRSWFARHKVLTTIGAVVLVVIVGGALGGGDDDTASSASPASATATDAGAVCSAADEAAAGEATAPDPAAAGIGTPVRDGKFEFTVTAIEPGVARIGDDLFGKDAQGQFTLADVTVTNIGDEAQYLDGSSQKLVHGQGRKHSADTSAAIYLGDAESFLDQINPGNSVQGTVVFDLPADAAPASLELHDSMLSGGVTVTVG